jgi:hypothetical protein
MDQMLSWNSFFRHLGVIGFEKVQHPIHSSFSNNPSSHKNQKSNTTSTKVSPNSLFSKHSQNMTFFIDVFISILKRIFPNYNETPIASFLILKTSKDTFTHFNTPTHIQAHDRTLSNLKQKQPTNALLLFNVSTPQPIYKLMIELCQISNKKQPTNALLLFNIP